MKLLSAHLFPVKSMRGVAVESFELDARGVVGDRRWMVVDAADKFLSQRFAPSMARVQPRLLEGGVRFELDDGASFEAARPGSSAARRTVTVWRDTFEALDAGDAVARWLTTTLGQPCRLVAFADDVHRGVDSTWARDAETSFTDGFPLLLTNEASLDALNASLSAPIGMERFRSNLVVRADAPWVEDGWTKLRVGDVAFEAVKPCIRCVVITTDQRTGEKPQSSEPLAKLAELHTLQVGSSRGAVFGQNVVHRGVGTIRVGSAVEIL